MTQAPQQNVNNPSEEDVRLATQMLIDMLLDNQPIDAQAVAYLEQQGADLKRLEPTIFQRTMLHVLAENVKEGAFEIALSHGIDPNAVTIGGSTALHLLVWHLSADITRAANTLEAARHIEQLFANIVQVMMAYGADPEIISARDVNVEPHEKETVLLKYCRANKGLHGPVAWALLDAGAEVDETSATWLTEYEDEIELNYQWQDRYKERWEAAKRFAAYPDPSQLSAEVLRGLNNLGRLGVLTGVSLSDDDRASMMEILMEVSPFLVEKIFCVMPQLTIHAVNEAPTCLIDGEKHHFSPEKSSETPKSR